MNRGDSPRPNQLASAKTILVAGSAVILLLLLRETRKGTTRLVLLVPVAVAVLSRLWVHVASHFVPEPYLDEVFHVPQAQKYCEGKYLEWDDKITTPPGLYILSLLVPRHMVSGDFTGIYGCDTASLRATNALALTALAYLAMVARRRIEAVLYKAHSGTAPGVATRYAAHTALNVALCPILFFFSGLYYTDVASTAVVLACLVNSLGRLIKERPSIMDDLATVALGLLALFMRQTNVFWVVVFLGSLEGIHAVKTLRPARVEQPVMNTLSERVKFFASRYSLGDVHDPPLRMSWPDDWLWSIVSILVAAACNPVRVLIQVWPYIAVLMSFIGFVFWNGGVVLGDKSNHVATIHLAQMLYIWPFFAFFSLPLLVPYALSVLSPILRLNTGSENSKNSAAQLKSKGSPGTSKIQPPKVSNPSKSLKFVASILSHKVIWPLYIALTMVISALIVKFNTIIHPFTLADNRHYMFYVFRYSIRRSQTIRLALIVPYTISRWLVWGTLTGGTAAWSSEERLENSRFLNHPLRPLEYEVHKAGTVRSQPTQTEQKSLSADSLAVSAETISTSTAVVFLLATTLSLITAPLVEPRYFIIPWVMWRLLVPAWRLRNHHDVVEVLRKHGGGFIVAALQTYDPRLMVETAWFVLINLGTIYVFLTKPYQWKAEDGSLMDEGRWQRFMW